MKRERSFVKQSGGKSRMMEEERREDSNNAAARGKQLVLGCILIIPQAAREPHPISLALSPFLSLSIFRSPPLRPRRGLRRPPLLVSQASRGTPPKREANKSKEAPRTAHRFSPFDRASSRSCPLRRSFLVFPPPFSSHRQGTTFVSTRLGKRTNGKKGHRRVEEWVVETVNVKMDESVMSNFNPFYC